MRVDLALTLLFLPLSAVHSAPCPKRRSTNAKRGLALVSPGDIGKVSGGVVSWEYNWAVAPPPSTNGLQHVPMQWGKDGIASFASAVKAQNAKTILVGIFFVRPPLAWPHRFLGIQRAGPRCAIQHISRRCSIAVEGVYSASQSRWRAFGKSCGVGCSRAVGDGLALSVYRGLQRMQY